MLKDHIMEEMKIILEQPHPTGVGWGFYGPKPAKP